MNKKITSSHLWYDRIINDNQKLTEDEKKNIENKIVKQLSLEIPSLLSVVFERTCNLSCQHCFYPSDCSSKKISEDSNLAEVIVKMAKQIPTKSTAGETPQFLHSGRILLPWHIDVMSQVKKSRQDIRIGMINNGGYTKYIENFKQQGLLLDWIDISLDGVRESHNRQRPAKIDAFEQTMNGLERAREIIKPDGYVASLFTLTKLNYQDITKSADLLFSKNPKQKDKPLSDLFAITTMAPTNDKNEQIEASMNFSKDNSEFEIAWKQIKEATKKYGSDKVILHIYRHEDIEKIAKVVGEKIFVEAMKRENIEIGLHDTVFTVDGIRVHFSPFSTWAKEELIIDADSVARTALSGCYTLDEYACGKSKKGKDISKFSVEKVNIKSNYNKIFQKVATQWWNEFGKKYIEEEEAVFNRIRQAAK